jgi:hypothetical protein
MAAHITDLEDAQDEAGLHTAGAVQVRNEKLAITKQDLKYLKHNVQLKADADLPNAESIITLCGLHIKKTAVVNKESFSVAHGQVSGQILLSAKSKGPRTANEWQMSDDGIVWTVLPSTLKAKTTVDGLTPPDKKYFRHRSLTKDGYTGWSAVLSIIVL